jgi:hypothetical protein
MIQITHEIHLLTGYLLFIVNRLYEHGQSANRKPASPAAHERAQRHAHAEQHGSPADGNCQPDA